MTDHSYRFSNFDAEGMKLVTSNAALASLASARIQLAGIEGTFAVDWLEIQDGIPTIHFELPENIRFDEFRCAGIESLENGAIRKIYFLRRFKIVTTV